MWFKTYHIWELVFPEPLRMFIYWKVSKLKNCCHSLQDLDVFICAKITPKKYIPFELQKSTLFIAVIDVPLHDFEYIFIKCWGGDGFTRREITVIKSSGKTACCPTCIAEQEPAFPLKNKIMCHETLVFFTSRHTLYKRLISGTKTENLQKNIIILFKVF